MKFYEKENFDEQTIFNDITDCDNSIQKFFEDLKIFESILTKYGCIVQGFDDSIKCAFAEISNELNKKLMALCQEMCTRKNHILRESLKNKTEILKLAKENKQLAEQIARLKQQISYMEENIGKNRPLGQAYKMSMINYYTK